MSILYYVELTADQIPLVWK